MLPGTACFNNTSEVHINIISQSGFVLLPAASDISTSHHFKFCTTCFPPSEKALSIFLGFELFYTLKLPILFPNCHCLQA